MVRLQIKSYQELCFRLNGLLYHNKCCLDHYIFFLILFFRVTSNIQFHLPADGFVSCNTNNIYTS